MTLPKGFGNPQSRSIKDSIAHKQNRYKPRPKSQKLKLRKTKYCDDCGHLKIVHVGFLTKGRCNVCMCPRFIQQYVKVTDL